MIVAVYSSKIFDKENITSVVNIPNREDKINEFIDYINSLRIIEKRYFKLCNVIDITITSERNENQNITIINTRIFAKEKRGINLKKIYDLIK